MLYQAYQTQRDLTAPTRALAGLATWTLGELPTGLTQNRLVRQMAAYGLPDCLRITIGTQDEMQETVDVLAAFPGVSGKSR